MNIVFVETAIIYAMQANTDPQVDSFLEAAYQALGLYTGEVTWNEFFAVVDRIEYVAAMEVTPAVRDHVEEAIELLDNLAVDWATPPVAFARLALRALSGGEHLVGFFRSYLTSVRKIGQWAKDVNTARQE